MASNATGKGDSSQGSWQFFPGNDMLAQQLAQQQKMAQARVKQELVPGGYQGPSIEAMKLGQMPLGMVPPGAMHGMGAQGLPPKQRTRRRR